MDLLDGLNTQQQQAVMAGLGPLLVMAGPGSRQTGAQPSPRGAPSLPLQPAVVEYLDRQGGPSGKFYHTYKNDKFWVAGCQECSPGLKSNHGLGHDWA